MNKPFLLILGSNYYPEQGSGDWKGCFATHGEARQQFEEKKYENFYNRGKNKGQLKSSYIRFILKDDHYRDEYDWCEIIDLNEWAN